MNYYSPLLCFIFSIRFFSNKFFFCLFKSKEIFKLSIVSFTSREALFQKAPKFAASKHTDAGQTVPGANLPYIVHLRNVARELQYFDWVNERKAMIDNLSGGRIGHIPVPNTSTSGNRELFHGMYADFNKEALIIDEHYNEGGFIPDRMADLLY